MNPESRDCEPHRARISDRLDNALGPVERRDLEQHLAGCLACREAAADLTRIREAVAELPRVQPPADAWPRIMRVIEADPQERDLRGAAREPGSPTRTLARWGGFGLPAGATSARPKGPGPRWLANHRPLVTSLAAAALVVLAVGSVVFWSRASRSQRSEPAAAVAQNPPATPVHDEGNVPVQSIDTAYKRAEQDFEQTIVGLEQIAQSGQTVLDPAIAATLQTNLGIIDGAIRESRTALETEPADEIVQESLFEALRHKVTLLQDTIALINEMRKGDEAGTARVMERLNSKS
jgi:anti-sigma factor RsiW